MESTAPTNRSKEWLAPLTGLAFLAVLIVSFVLVGEPKDASHPPEEIVEFYTDNESSIMIGAFLSALAAGLFVFFAGYLRRVLRVAEGEGGMLSLISFGGALLVAAGAATDATITLAIADRAEDITPESVQTLQALWDADFIPMALGILVFVWATGLSILRHGALPSWLGWILIVLGVVAATPAGLFAFFGVLIWIAIASVVLTIQERRGVAAT